MENSLALRKQSVITSVDDIERVATSMAKSGYFQDSREMAQAVVKIMAGQEMGFGPFASMTGVYVIQGRPSVSANLMASAVKASGKYNYRVLEMTDTACEIAFTEGGQEIGRSRFTADDARKAGTKNMDKFPKNMLFARAMSNGVRWYTPDVFSGAPTYTPEELGADVNESGDVIAGSFVEASAPAPAPVKQNGNGNGHAPEHSEWPAETIQHVMDEWKLQARPQAKNILNLSNLPKTAPTDVVDNWIRTYRANKDSAGMTTQEAAAAANQEFANQPA